MVCIFCVQEQPLSCIFSPHSNSSVSGSAFVMSHVHLRTYFVPRDFCRCGYMEFPTSFNSLQYVVFSSRQGRSLEQAQEMMVEATPGLVDCIANIIYLCWYYIDEECVEWYGRQTFFVVKSVHFRFCCQMSIKYSNLRSHSMRDFYSQGRRILEAPSPLAFCNRCSFTVSLKRLLREFLIRVDA